jgi:endonuclease-8
MPEGDALYRFAGRVHSALAGKVIRAARSHGPGPVPQVERLVGATCLGARSVGKNLVIEFDNGLSLRGHLRMYGTWHVYRPGQPWSRPEREARLVLEVDDAVVVNFSAPVIELLETRALFQSTGRSPASARTSSRRSSMRPRRSRGSATRSAPTLPSATRSWTSG